MQLSTSHTQANSTFALLVRAVIIACVSSMAIAHAASPQVGDRVEAEWKRGLWYTAKIIEINAGQYKVRYESDGIIQDVTSDRLRRNGASGSTPATSPSVTNGKVPVLTNGFPIIPGTAWKIDWGIRGGNVQVFLFCKSGRWEVVSPMLSSGAVTLMGTYKLQGHDLVTQNENGREVTSYRMAWNANVLELDSGKSRMRLHYNGTTECR